MSYDANASKCDCWRVRANFFDGEFWSWTCPAVHSEKSMANLRSIGIIIIELRTQRLEVWTDGTNAPADVALFR